LIQNLDEDVTEERGERMDMIKSAGCSYLFTMKQLVQLLKGIGTKKEKL
jgi:hypothetical protein